MAEEPKLVQVRSEERKRVKTTASAKSSEQAVVSEEVLAKHARRRRPGRAPEGPKTSER